MPRAPPSISRASAVCLIDAAAISNRSFSFLRVFLNLEWVVSALEYICPSVMTNCVIGSRIRICLHDQ